MTLESYCRSLPKVEPLLVLEGAIPVETLMMLAEQNEIPAQVKRFNDVRNQLTRPEYKRFDELMTTTSTWLLPPEDLTRVVYDVGVTLARQNVRYAEVAVSPASFVSSEFTFEHFLAAINDGRDRVWRAWQVQLQWMLMLPRAEPRRVDEVARWATSVTARRGGVVAVVVPPLADASQYVNFERGAANAMKRDLPRVVYFESGNADVLREVLAIAAPARLVAGAPLFAQPDALALARERGVPLHVVPQRALAQGWWTPAALATLRTLIEEGHPVTVGVDTPMLLRGHLEDTLLRLLQEGGMGADHLDALLLNAARGALLPDDARHAMVSALEDGQAARREEHLSDAGASPSA